MRPPYHGLIEMTIPIVTLRPKEDKRIASGHLWVFSNEIAGITGSPKTGDVVEVKSSKSISLGYGFYNPNTLIAVRIFTRNYVEPDETFFIDRIKKALSLRQGLFPNNFYRLVYGESDFLPGLIIDRFDSFFTVQILSAAMELRKSLIYRSIQALFTAEGIYERNESRTRELEGLPLSKSIVLGDEKDVVYDEEGVVYRIRPFQGQKTGFYFDQRLNRIMSRRFSGNVDALDLFCNDGGFALNLAFAGARSVVAVDSSSAAIENVRNNSELNSLNSIQVESIEVERFLSAASASGRTFDLVVSDPPSFTKNRKSVPAAKAGYRRLHQNILKVLSKGGILLTASCSHHIFRQTFEEIVAETAQEQGRSVQLLYRGGASPDHPILPAMPETEYLKFNAYRII